MADIFLKFQDIQGEAQDADHTNEIDVISWSWGMTQSGSAHVGGGAGTGKVSVRDVTVVKYVDKSTPNLVKHCCAGTHWGEATITVRKAGGKTLPYFVLKMKDGMVSSHTTGEMDHDGRMIETIGLNFASFEIEYQEQDKTGKAKGGKIPAKWHIAKNAES